MKGSTLIIERHEWRGWKTIGGEIGVAKVRGFWTITYVPFLLSEWLKARLDKMKNAIRAGRVPHQTRVVPKGKT